MVGLFFLSALAAASTTFLLPSAAAAALLSTQVIGAFKARTSSLTAFLEEPSKLRRFQILLSRYASQVSGHHFRLRQKATSRQENFHSKIFLHPGRRKILFFSQASQSPLRLCRGRGHTGWAQERLRRGICQVGNNSHFFVIFFNFFLKNVRILCPQANGTAFGKVRGHIGKNQDRIVYFCFVKNLFFRHISNHKIRRVPRFREGFPALGGAGLCPGLPGSGAARRSGGRHFQPGGKYDSVTM